MKTLTSDFLLTVERADQDLTRVYMAISPLLRKKALSSAQFVHAVIENIREYTVENVGIEPPSDADTVLKHEKHTIVICNQAGILFRNLSRLSAGLPPSPGAASLANVLKMFADFRDFIRRQIAAQIPF